MDGKNVKPTHHPRAGERITLQPPAARPAGLEAEEMALEILYEDADLVVVNKAAGMVVHLAAGHRGQTLVNALLHHCAENSAASGGGEPAGHRASTDKDTSGCLVAAKKIDAARVHLAAQFAGREVEKSYLALVCGRMTRMSRADRGGDSADPAHRKQGWPSAVGKGGRRGRATGCWNGGAGRRWWRRSRAPGGRIRYGCICARRGISVAGDAVYGRRATARLKEATGYSAPRLLLHARRLG